MTPQEENDRDRRLDERFITHKVFTHKSEINLALAQFINKEIERKKGMRKELPQIKKFPEKYKDNIEVNPETISIVMNNVIAMNYIGHYEYGYNKAIDEDIAHLTSLKELYK